MTEFDDDPLLADLEDAPLPAPTDLAGVERLARLLVAQETEVASLEAALETAQKNLRITREQDLPMAMANCGAGVSSMTLASGETIQVERALFYGIAKGKESQACDWFDDVGYGDLLKRRITVLLGKEEADLAPKVLANIRSGPGGNRVEVKYDKTINWQTLGAFIRARLKDGSLKLPEELLGMHRPMVARVTKPKDKEIPF